MHIYLLAVAIGLVSGVLAAAFHYCLQKVFYLHGEVAALFSGGRMITTVVAALLGASMTAIAVILVRGMAPEADPLPEVKFTHLGHVAMGSVQYLYRRRVTVALTFAQGFRAQLNE